MDLLLVFARNMRHYRTQAGYSQEKFAEYCGLHRTYISSVERCQRNISLENVQKIADGLNVPAYKLLMDEESEQKS